MTSWKNLLGPMRVPFLLLTPACVLLGVGTAYWQTGHLAAWWHIGLVLVAALAAHISVNALNEYVDFKTGLDLRTQRTPFSGGSGTLPQQPTLAPAALWIGLISLLVLSLIGAYFVALRGWTLAMIGLLGILVIVAYTPLITRLPVLCLIAPGLGFGPLMVIGTHLALGGELSATVVVASLVPFFLVNNLLLLNQFPDVEADRSVGRHHYPILLGRQRSAYIYALFLGLAYLSVVVGVVGGVLPATSLLGLLAAILLPRVIRGVLRHADDLPHLMPYLGLNVTLNLITPVLVAVGLFLAA
ncbi:ubiquinone biosynthesis protein UbiA [Thermanaerothrix daxensis]|uniref:Ubiquinone biosynthesis protein UbiA n=1 Tax=Thermanaerothrix daxensis TaxID=869279 RepID=A0A0N8GQ03_9CHLR|nr:prenyltransferase [Thermanaerothrix daxensis]KPL82338.1 ubiquinone biosynthesis protein UbiA [Thermanaerothrix daxensis]